MTENNINPCYENNVAVDTVTTASSTSDGIHVDNLQTTILHDDHSSANEYASMSFEKFPHNYQVSSSTCDLDNTNNDYSQTTFSTTSIFDCQSVEVSSEFVPMDYGSSSQNNRCMINVSKIESVNVSAASQNVKSSIFKNLNLPDGKENTSNVVPSENKETSISKCPDTTYSKTKNDVQMDPLAELLSLPETEENNTSDNVDFLKNVCQAVEGSRMSKNVESEDSKNVVYIEQVVDGRVVKLPLILETVEVDDTEELVIEDDQAGEMSANLEDTFFDHALTENVHNIKSSEVPLVSQTMENNILQDNTGEFNMEMFQKSGKDSSHSNLDHLLTGDQSKELSVMSKNLENSIFEQDVSIKNVHTDQSVEVKPETELQALSPNIYLAENNKYQFRKITEPMKTKEIVNPNSQIETFGEQSCQMSSVADDEDIRTQNFLFSENASRSQSIPVSLLTTKAVTNSTTHESIETSVGEVSEPVPTTSYPNNIVTEAHSMKLSSVSETAQSSLENTDSVDIVDSNFKEVSLVSKPVKDSQSSIICQKQQKALEMSFKSKVKTNDSTEAAASTKNSLDWCEEMLLISQPVATNFCKDVDSTIIADKQATEKPITEREASENNHAITNEKKIEMASTSINNDIVEKNDDLVQNKLLPLVDYQTGKLIHVVYTLFVVVVRIK